MVTAERREAKRAYDAARYQEVRERKVAQAVAWRSDRRREWAYKANATAARQGLPGRIDWRDLIPEPCAYCWAPCESWDHVTPLSRGGANDLANIVPCCWPCNQDKRARTPDEWLAGVPARYSPRPDARTLFAARTLHEAGHSIRTIAGVFGVSRYAVTTWLEAA
jgi:5-methylcytosine-specific restriction endonuclease McrA